MQGPARSTVASVLVTAALHKNTEGYKEPWFLVGGLGVSPKLKTYGAGGWEDRHLPFVNLLEQSP